MNIFIYLFVSVLVLLIIYRFKSYGFHQIGVQRLKKVSIKAWMQMTSDQRADHDILEKELSLQRKRDLLSAIRKDYKRLTKKSK